MSAARKLLLISAFVLGLWGMSFGFCYAVWVEHQTLDAMGGQLAGAFMSAASHDLPQAHASLAAYTATNFAYVRQVDVHSHWIGLALVLFVLGLGFDRVRLGPRQQYYAALGLSAGSALFPLGVFLQTAMSGSLPGIFAVAGAALIIVSLGMISLGFARP